MKILYLPSCKCQQRQFEKPNFTAYPILMAMECEKRRQEGHEVYWAKDGGDYNFVFDYGDHKVLPYDKVITEPEGLDFLSLPKPDRVFTRAMDKKYQSNGNFKYLPGTYIMSASGCWWGKCTFCVENKWEKNTDNVFCTCSEYQYSGNTAMTSVSPKGKFDSLVGTIGNPFVCYKCLKPRKEPKNNYLVRPVDSVIEEIEECKSLGFRELFDDSATFQQGGWLDDFLDKFAPMGKELRFSCNWRLCDYDYTRLRNAGFRMLLFGVESANQKTLDKINKGVKVEDIKYIKKAAKAGLEPHISVLFGTPGETDKDSIKTLKLVHFLLKKGWAKTAQASFYCVPNEKGNESQRKYVKKIYDIAYSPTFWFNKIRDIHNVDDLKYLWRAIKKGLGR